MPVILILTPNEAAFEPLRQAVLKAEMSAVVLTAGKKALDYLAGEPTSLIVLDLAIDSQKGLALCHAIRETATGSLVPILMIGSGEEGVRSFGDALAEGGDYYFDKPVDLPTLISKIQTYVGVAPT